MAPEVLRCESVAEPADVYSYGVVLWELITGRAPWESYNAMQVVALVGFRGMSLTLPATAADPYLLELCGQCMQRDPAARPSFPQIVNLLDSHYGPPAWTSHTHPLMPPSALLDAVGSTGGSLTIPAGSLTAFSEALLGSETSRGSSFRQQLWPRLASSSTEAGAAEAVAEGPPTASQAYPPQTQAYAGWQPGAPAPGMHAQGYIAPGAYAPGPPPVVVQGRPPLVSIISPEDARKIRKMQWINFACTMLQLGSSVAIILIIRNNLTRIVVGIPSGGQAAFWDYDCFAATPAHPATCEYGISLASVSIFFGFILSLMQCLTMDCCGMGRAIEAGFDAAAFAWWIAGAVTMGLRASEANAIGVPQASSRNAVVALCCISAIMFLALLVTNCILIKRLGRAYKAAAQQMQQHMTAYPGGGANVQMVPMQPGGPVNAAGGATFPGAAPPYQQQGPPAGYPTHWTPPQSGAAGGHQPPPQGHQAQPGQANNTGYNAV
eukprot:gene5079-5320_t